MSQKKGLGGKKLITALMTAYELRKQGLPAYELVLEMPQNSMPITNDLRH